MPSLPLPFIVALLLLVLVVRLVPTGAAGRGLAGFFAVCAAQAVMIGLRWNYDILLSRALLPVLSAAAGPLAWTMSPSQRHSVPSTPPGSSSAQAASAASRSLTCLAFPRLRRSVLPACIRRFVAPLTR